jgi:hypothetical protein
MAYSICRVCITPRHSVLSATVAKFRRLIVMHVCVTHTPSGTRKAHRYCYLTASIYCCQGSERDDCSHTARGCQMNSRTVPYRQPDIRLLVFDHSKGVAESDAGPTLDNIVLLSACLHAYTHLSVTRRNYVKVAATALTSLMAFSV